MFVFVDDSGDCGFDFAGGSSTHVVMSAVVVPDRQAVEKIMTAVAAARYSFTPSGQEIVYKREFKYSSCPRNAKDKFFNSVRAAPFALRTIILDKRRVWSPHLRQNPNSIKSYLIRQMLSNTRGTVREAKLIIDGDDTRAFGATDREYLMRMVNRVAPGTIGDVGFADSKRSQGIQIADMTAGAIRKHLDGDPHGVRHYQTFSHRFAAPNGSRWVFK